MRKSDYTFSHEFSELKSKWKRRSKEVKEIIIHQEDEAMSAPWIPVLERKLYLQYTYSVESADQSLQKIKHHKAVRQDCPALFPESESLFQVLGFIEDNSALKGWVM